MNASGFFNINFTALHPIWTTARKPHSPHAVP